MNALNRNDPRPLIMHVVYRFGVGGLENGVVNLINRLPAAEFRHALIALTSCDPDFCRRVRRDDVVFVSLDKPPGQGSRVFRRIWRLFRAYRPAIVHTRNLAALEMQLPAWAARVPVRVHGEHGRDVSDPDGSNRRYRFVRRAMSPFVTHYVTVSRDLEQYLVGTLGMGRERVSSICNGVDERKFRPASAGERANADGRVVVGTIGRLEPIKHQHLLLVAVARLLEQEPARRRALRVELVGDGPTRPALERAVAELGLAEVVELLGEREDVADVMRRFDVFVLPSLAEGISNTILEAMSSGLPVVATAVGGNAELVTHERNGVLVPSEDAGAMAAAIARYLDQPDLRREHGRQGRADIEAKFALSIMVERYRALYRGALKVASKTGAAAMRGSEVR